MPLATIAKAPCSSPRPAARGRKSVGGPARPRHLDPTTCERNYTADEIEFMRAVERYKRRTGRMFPTCSEMLTVVRSLGYQRRSGEA